MNENLLNAIRELTNQEHTKFEAMSVNLAMCSTVAFHRGMISLEYFQNVLRTISKQRYPFIFWDVTAKMLWSKLMCCQWGAIIIDIPIEGNSVVQAVNLTLRDIESAIRYLKMAQIFIENVKASDLIGLETDDVIEIPVSDVGQYSQSSILALRNRAGKIHVFADKNHGARVNIRHVPDIKEICLSRPEFARATEMIPLYGYQSKEFHVKKFRGWHLLSEKLRTSLSDLFSRNVVPLTYKEGVALSDFKIALETNRQHDVAPGRTGQLLFDDGFVVVKDENDKEFILEMKGIGPCDGTFSVRDRRIFKGTIDGQKVYIDVKIGRGYVNRATSSEEHDSEHLQTLQNEPASLVSILPIPVFQIDFEIDGYGYSLHCRLSPGNRRMGQYWCGMSLLHVKPKEVAKVLGRSTMNMFLEEKPVVHWAFNLENLFDSVSCIAAYANPGSICYLYAQRHVYGFVEKFLTMAEERVMYAWDQYDVKHLDLLQSFWSGFIDLLVKVVDLPECAKKQLLSERAGEALLKTHSMVTQIIWKDYLLQKILENREKYDYDPKQFMLPTYSGEHVLFPEQLEEDWVLDEIKLYGDAMRFLSSSDYSNIIMIQRNKLEEAIKELDLKNKEQYLVLLREQKEAGIFSLLRKQVERSDQDGLIVSQTQLLIKQRIRDELILPPQLPKDSSDLSEKDSEIKMAPLKMWC